MLARVLRGSVELSFAGVHFFPMRTNTCFFLCLNSVRARRSGPLYAPTQDTAIGYKRPLCLALTEFKHIKKHVFVRMGKKCTPASGSPTLPRRTRPYTFHTGLVILSCMSLFLPSSVSPHIPVPFFHLVPVTKLPQSFHLYPFVSRDKSVARF
jgi:hypothetical protein